MPLNADSIITTVGASDSNSYVTLAEYASYRDLNRINADAFDAASPDDKVRSLVMAAKRLNRLNWRGGKADGNQALAWPRLEVPVRDSSLVGVGSYTLGYYANNTLGFFGDYYPGDSVPQIIKDAQCELAIAYLEGFESSEGQQIKRFVADGVTIEYGTTARSGELPVAVRQMVSGMLVGERLVRA